MAPTIALGGEKPVAATMMESSELDHIFCVVQRDEVLRILEQNRIQQLTKQLGLDVVELVDRNDKATINCNVCGKTFGILFNRRQCCFVCKMFVCSRCCFVMFRCKLCKLCERRRFVRERALEWFYFCLRQRHPQMSFGADLIKQLYGKSTSFCCSVEVQTDELTTDSVDRVGQLWGQLARDASTMTGSGDGPMSLKDHCEIELLNELSSLTSEVKLLVNKIDVEEHDAINAIATCYKRRLAWIISQYTKIFYVVLMLKSPREKRLQIELPCRNCRLDKHANDAYCHHMELCYSARNIVENLSSSVLAAECRPGIVSPFSDQTICDTVISDFEQQLAGMLIDDAVKQSIFGKKASTPNDKGLDIMIPSGRLSNDDGIHSDLSSIYASMAAGDDSLIATSRFKGAMTDCPKVTIDQGNNNNDTGIDHTEYRSNNNSSLESRTVEELASICESPTTCSAESDNNNSRLDNSSFAIGDYSVASDSTGFDVMVSHYSTSAGPCSDSFNFSPSDNFDIPIDEISVEVGERAKFSLTINSNSQIANVAWFVVIDAKNDQPSSLIEIGNNSKYKIAVPPALRLSDDTYKLTLDLEIIDADTDDSGRYMCRVTNIDGRSIARILSLTVKEDTYETSSSSGSSSTVTCFVAPEFIAIPEPTYNVFTGDKLCLRAAVRAQPTASITWSKRGQPFALSLEKRVSVVELSEMDSRLVFDDVAVEDEAEYVVVAKNKAGETQAVTQIFVEERKLPDKGSTPKILSRTGSLRSGSQHFVSDMLQQVSSQLGSDKSLNQVLSTSADFFLGSDSGCQKPVNESVIKRAKSIEINSSINSELSNNLSRSQNDSDDGRRLSVRELAERFKGSQDEIPTPFSRVASLTYRSRHHSLSKSTAPNSPKPTERSYIARYDSFAGNPCCEDDSAPNSSMRARKPYDLSERASTSCNFLSVNDHSSSYNDLFERTRNVIYSHQDSKKQ